MATDQFDEVTVFTDHYCLRLTRGLKYLDVGRVSQAKIAQGYDINCVLF